MVNARYLGTFVLGMILFNTMFFSIEGAAQDRDPEFVDALKQQPHIVWPDCIITDIDGKILKKMIGYLCVPFSDGTYLSTNDKYLRFFSADNEIVNKLEIYPHHQLKTHSNDTRILAIGSKYSEYKGKKNRFDVIYEISREGDILKEFDFGRNFSKLFQKIQVHTQI